MTYDLEINDFHSERTKSLMQLSKLIGGDCLALSQHTQFEVE